jgi:XTP/dITP diphosphohydrolase
MISDILIASTNNHKFEEIGKILDFPGIIFHSLKEYRDISPPEENGQTFKDNAKSKAKYYHQQLRLPVITDDSGLVVPALNGEPGVHSARYGGEGSTYLENNGRLLSRMRDLTGSDRNAYFVCCVVFYDENILLLAEGRAEGVIIDSPRGRQGFGYDPLFYYPPLGKTFAEMEAIEKNKVSHRYQALQSLRHRFEKILTQES